MGWILTLWTIPSYGLRLTIRMSRLRRRVEEMGELHYELSKDGLKLFETL